MKYSFAVAALLGLITKDQVVKALEVDETVVLMPIEDLLLEMNSLLGNDKNEDTELVFENEYDTFDDDSLIMMGEMHHHLVDQGEDAVDKEAEGSDQEAADEGSDEEEAVGIASESESESDSAADSASDSNSSASDDDQENV